MRPWSNYSSLRRNDESSIPPHHIFDNPLFSTQVLFKLHHTQNDNQTTRRSLEPASTPLHPHLPRNPPLRPPRPIHHHNPLPYPNYSPPYANTISNYRPRSPIHRATLPSQHHPHLAPLAQDEPSAFDGDKSDAGGHGGAIFAHAYEIREEILELVDWGDGHGEGVGGMG